MFNLPLDPAFILIGALVLIVVFLVIWIIRLESRMRHLLKGKDAKSLEDTITTLMKDIASLKRFRQDSTTYLEEVENRIQKSVRHVETIRFNPFQGTGEGGNQSFATAFVNEQGDGVVITSLRVRDNVSVFAKPVKKFSSEHDLTDEEKHVIEQAKKSLS